MKIKRGDSQLTLPEMGQLLGVVVRYEHSDGQVLKHRVSHVHRETIFRQKFEQPDVLGCPMYCTVDGNKLMFWPAASMDMDILIRYYPPEVEA